MQHSSTLRGIRAVALAFLTLSSILAGAGCGKGGGGGPTDPSEPVPSDPGPSDPEPVPQAPAPVGDVIFAVDLANNFLVFGSGSLDVLSAKMRITGLPILKRIIGLAVRPSDGKLIGVGNDSQVYTIDPSTARATPVGSGPFAPKIADFFDIHFAMALEPNGQRVRLIAAESGANWSIDITGGSATSGEIAEYAAGTALAGQTPRLLGLVYPRLSESAKQPGMCENLAYAIDADEAIMLASCDPAGGEWSPTGAAPEPAAIRAPVADPARMSHASGPRELLEDLKGLIERCGEVLTSPPTPGDTVYSNGEPEPQEGEQWNPETPETTIFDLWMIAVFGGSNQVGTVESADAGGASVVASGGSARSLVVNWQGEVPSAEPIQTAVFVPAGTYTALRMSAARSPRFSVAAEPEREQTTSPGAQGDPRARCT